MIRIILEQQPKLHKPCSSIYGQSCKGEKMVRLEKQGDSFVMITGASKKLDFDVLLVAISELQKPSPDKTKIKEGLLYLDESGQVDIRKELKTALQKAFDYRGMTITDL